MYISCSLKMLNAHLYNAQYKHLTYIHLISRNSYSPTKGVTVEVRGTILFSRRSATIARRGLIRRASETH